MGASRVRVHDSQDCRGTAWLGSRSYLAHAPAVGVAGGITGLVAPCWGQEHSLCRRVGAAEAPAEEPRVSCGAHMGTGTYAVSCTSMHTRGTRV